MHRKLLDQAVRKAWLWIVLLAALGGLVTSIIVGLGWNSFASGVVIFLLIFVLNVFAWLTPRPLTPNLKQVKAPVVPAVAAVQEVADGVSIALGQPPLTVVEVKHESPNVGVLRWEGKEVLAVTSGALRALTRNELESVMAMQMAIVKNRSVARLLPAAGRINLFSCSPVLTLVLFSPIFFITPVVILIAGLVFGGLPAVFLKQRLLWWLRVASDGAAIETTRFPDPLPGALCKLAIYRGQPLPMGLAAKFGVADFCWAVPLYLNDRRETQVNGRVISISSSHLEADLRLFLSAELIKQAYVAGKPATMASYLDTVARVKQVQHRLAAGETEVTIGDYVFDIEGMKSKA